MKNLYSWICLLALISLGCKMSAALSIPQPARTKQAEASVPTVPTATVFDREVCAESLWVRDAPMGVRRGGFEIGDRVEVFAAVDGWAQIASGKWRGLWVRESWLCDG